MSNLPKELPQGVNTPCKSSSFAEYSWKDISCNFNGYGYHIPWNASVFCLYAAVTAIAIQLAVELIGRTLLRFKRRTTLYFWSLIIVAVGIVLYALAFLFRVFVFPVGSPAFPVPYTLAQICILTGFGLVQYSRLHLITNTRIVLRGMFIMIMVVAVLGHTMTFVQLAVISLKKELLSRRIYNAIAWLDVIFTVQDSVLSTTYIYFSWREMKSASEYTNEHVKRREKTNLRLLVIAGAVVLIMDILQNVLLCLRIYIARSMWLPLLCAIKLEVEFFVLNRLVKTSELNSEALQGRAINFGADEFPSKQDRGVADSRMRHNERFTENVQPR